MSSTTDSLSLPPLSEAARREAATWLERHGAEIPAAVAETIAFGVAVARSVTTAKQRSLLTQLRRALGIIPSSEKRKHSGKPLAGAPPGKRPRQASERERLAAQRDRSKDLGSWYRRLANRHARKVKKLNERLMKLEDTPLSPEEEAVIAAEQEAHDARLDLGGRCDLDSAKSSESLLRGAVARLDTLPVSLEVDRLSLPQGSVVKQQFFDERERISFSFAVTHVVLDVEKLSVEKAGNTTLIAASLDEIGPPKMKVTWEFLANMTIMVCQYAMPLSRFAALASSVVKRFTSGEVSRYFRFVALRFAPIYVHLGRSLADSDVLSGDDTPSLVIEVAKALKAKARGSDEELPWAHYATREQAVQALTAAAGPQPGAQLAASFGFEFARKNTAGKKVGLNTTVLSGRSDAFDPKSLIIFYRSHLGGLGNLLDTVLAQRRPDKKKLVIQSDLSTVNLVSEPKLKSQLDITLVGCLNHARRPFALHEDDDPDLCGYILHSFKGLAIFEGALDIVGRNHDNTLAVREADERQAWEAIRHGAELVTKRWARDTPLGDGARYILRHYDKLTYYLTDHRLMASNNFSERMLRLEKQIEDSALFRQTLEGRFALDIMRTVLQTAIASGVNLEAYLSWVMRMPPEVVRASPADFTPLAFARHGAANAREQLS